MKNHTERHASDAGHAKPIEHAGEDESNALRRRAASIEPEALKTFTPSMAVLARSEGCYHWTPEGRKLADFTSGVLVSTWGTTRDAGGSACSSTWGSTRRQRRANSYQRPRSPHITRSRRWKCRPPSAWWPACARSLAAAACSKCCGLQPAAKRSKRRSGRRWRGRPGSDVILATRYGFHGKKGLAGAVTGTERDADRDPRVRFLSFPTRECESVARRREPLDLTAYEKELNGLAAEYGQRICCLVTEPYLGGGGSYHPQPEYLRLLESFCRRHDVVFILDEVQANFGRTGSLYAFSHYGVEPDIVVLGKGLGNGIPVDAAVGRADLFAALHYGAGSDTWSAHPLGCAGGAGHA